MKYFTQINKILSKKQKISAVFLGILIIIAMIFEILTLNSIFLLLSFMTNPTGLNESQVFIYLENLKLNYDINLVITVFFITVFTLKTLINIYISWKDNQFTHYTRAELSYTYFKGYLCLPYIFHLRSNTSSLIRNITLEIESFASALKALINTVMEVVILIGLSIFLLFVNYKITILSIILLLIFSIILNFINTKKILSMGRNRIKLVQLRLKSIIEGLSGSKEFQMTGSQKNLIKDFSVHNNSIAKIAHSVAFRTEIPRPLFEIFVLSIVGVIFIFTFQGQSSLKNIIPTLGVFLTAAYRLIPSFGRILGNIQRFQFQIQSAEILSKDVEKFNLQNATAERKKSKLNFKDSISFKDVNFSYNENLNKDTNFVLTNINLKINKGSKIGIMGGSGSGKSTFLDLVMGLIVPQKGKILIDGEKIENIKSEWQKNIGCVPQEVFILDDTLKRNIAFGLPNDLIDEEKVNKAIELANLTEFKNNLELGLETLLGESGSRLSGGQRQRIGIARALYTNPNILIFDEATNALDVQTEKKIINEIFSTKENKTVIFVSHNRDNLIHCDSIYEVKKRGLYKIN